jgi:nucleoside-diphosphate-sugar epimerase
MKNNIEWVFGPELDNFESLKFTVLGGAGFVGDTLCKILIAQGHEVLCIDNCLKGHVDNLFSINSNRFTFVEDDIRNDCSKYIENADVVVNLAAIVGLPSCKKVSNIPIVQDVNCNAIKNILESIKKTGKDIVFIQASTDSIFGAVDVECNETTTPNPQSTYGSSKLEAEKLIQSYNLNSVILRFSTGCSVSGNMRVNLLVNDLVFTALETKQLQIYEAEVFRTFISVTDMARAIIHFASLARKKENKHIIYCVGDDRMNYSKGKLAELISQKTGCKVTYMDGSDSDKRNYRISHNRLKESGFECIHMMDSIIDDLIRIYPILHQQKKYQ